MFMFKLPFYSLCSFTFVNLIALDTPRKSLPPLDSLIIYNPNIFLEQQEYGKNVIGKAIAHQYL
jgi:hypothetical protein